MRLLFIAITFLLLLLSIFLQVDKNAVRRYTHLRRWFRCLNDAYFVTCCILIKKDEKRRKSFFYWSACDAFSSYIMSVVSVIIICMWYEKWDCQNFVGVHEWANWFCLFLYLFQFQWNLFHVTILYITRYVWMYSKQGTLLNEFIVLLIFLSLIELIKLSIFMKHCVLTLNYYYGRIKCLVSWV
jgi:hypothetical protein